MGRTSTPDNRTHGRARSNTATAARASETLDLQRQECLMSRGSGQFLAQIAQSTQSGLDPSDVAAQVISAIRDDKLYVFTHYGPHWRAEREERFRAILATMDEAAALRPG
jgi:hypothetical protein